MSATAEQRRTLAEHLTGGDLNASTALHPAPACASTAPQLGAGPDVVGWGVGLENQRHFGPGVTSLTAADRFMSWSDYETILIFKSASWVKIVNMVTNELIFM